MASIVSHNLKETKNIARDFVEKLRTGSKATVICLKGELGSGKTTFTKLAAKSLGIKKNITSPTFVIMRSYKLKAKSYKLIYHIDAYRLKSGKELKLLGWDDIIKDPKNLIFLEWPENVKDVLPKDFLEIHFKFIDQSKRAIKTIWPKK